MERDNSWSPVRSIENVWQSLSRASKSSWRHWEAAAKFMAPTPHGGIVTLPNMAIRAARCASLSFKLPVLPLAADKEAYERDLQMINTPEEDRQKTLESSLNKYMEHEKVTYKEKKMDLKTYMEQLHPTHKSNAEGNRIDTLNEVAENEKKIRKMNEIERHPSATQMHLDPDREASLELVNVGSGIRSKGFWGGDQFSYALFAKPEKVRDSLGKKWAGQDPEKVLKSPEYYNDIIQFSPEYELTLLVIPKKRLSLFQMQREYKRRLSKTLVELNASKTDHNVLDELVAMFNGNTLRGRVPWLSGTRILPGTMIYFSSAPSGNLKVEVTNPGPLATQSTGDLGMASNPLVTCALFADLLGNRPLSPEFKSLAAQNMLYFANGFTDGTTVTDIRQVNVAGPPTFRSTEVEVKPSVFELTRSSKGKLMFKGKNICQTKEIVSEEDELEVDYHAIT